MVLLPMKDELNCAMVISGAQSVTMDGTTLMPVWPADKLASHHPVTLRVANRLAFFIISFKSIQMLS